MQGDPRQGPDDILPALARAGELMREHRVPVIVELILERVTNIAMGTEFDNIGDSSRSSMRRPKAQR